MKRTKEGLLSRRDFLKDNVGYTGGLILYSAVPSFGNTDLSSLNGQVLCPTMIGNLEVDDTPAPIDGSRWYIAEKVGDGLHYSIEKGSLAEARFLVADMLLKGNASPFASA